MKLKFLFIGLLLVTGLLLAPIAMAQNIRSGDNPSLAASETVNSDYFAAGDTVNLQGTVNGDAYLAGGNVNVTGIINGDLLAAGGNINITGTVTGNIRTAGGTILFNGKVGRNLTAVGGNINSSPEALIQGSAVIGGGNISLLGPITKGLTIGGGQVTLGNQIGGDVTAGVSELSLGSEAKVNGNLTYWSEHKIQQSPEASVSGKVTQNIPPKSEKKAYDTGKATAAGVIGFFKILSFVTALVTGLLLLKLVPNYVQANTSVITNSPLFSLAIGFAALALTPVMVLLLIITLVGIPFAIVWMFFIVAAMWLAKIFISLVIGVWAVKLFNQKVSIYLAFVVGLILYYLISLIPIAGWLVGFISALIGLGAMITTKRNYYLDLRKKEVI